MPPDGQIRQKPICIVGSIWGNLRLMSQLHIILLVMGLVFIPAAQAQTNRPPLTREELATAERLIGLDFSQSKLEMMLPGLQAQLGTFESLHRFSFSNAVPPAVLFNPIPVGMKLQPGRSSFRMSPTGKVTSAGATSRTWPITPLAN